MPKIKTHSKTPLVANLNELKPLSKNELQAVFDKFKTRANDEKTVTELPDKEEDGRESPMLPGLRKHPLGKWNPPGRSRSVIPGENTSENTEIKAKRYPSPSPVKRKITEQKVSFQGGKVPWRRLGYQDSSNVTQKTEGSNLVTKTPMNQESITPKNPFEEKLKWEEADRTTTDRDKRGKTEMSSGVDAKQLKEALSKLNPRPEAKIENNKSTKSQRS